MGLKIAIVGAGIGGLSWADAGHEVALIERFPEPKPAGSGLVIQPLGLAVLDRFWAGDAAGVLGRPIARMAGLPGIRLLLATLVSSDMIPPLAGQPFP